MLGPMAWPGAHWSRGDIFASLTLAAACIGAVATILAYPSLRRLLTGRSSAPSRKLQRLARRLDSGPPAAKAADRHWSRGDIVALTGVAITVVGVVAAILAIPGMPRLLPWDKPAEQKPQAKDEAKADIQPSASAQPVSNTSNVPADAARRSSTVARPTLYTVKVLHNPALSNAPWLLDDQPAEAFVVSHDLNVTALRLPAGVHHIAATVEGRACKNSFSVPVQGPVFLDCVDSDSGRSR